MSYRKKLIEVALPLEAINAESAREKSIRHGHPSTLHLWWARRPLAACRAVLFAQLVDDPSAHPEKFPTEAEQETERQRLFELIEKLVKWENINDETLLEQARAEIRASAGPDGPPPLLDPFAGGGSIPLEAQRLGLEAHASDLNPVAVLINKALIEIPPKFANRPPVNPRQNILTPRRQDAETPGNKENENSSRLSAVAPLRLFPDEWRGAKGLAEDVRYYGRWMRDEAEKRIGHLYPKVKLPPEYGGGEATVIAWLWARTVKCPNPACGAEAPLTRSFWLSTRKGAEAWAEPIVDLKEAKATFQVHKGPPPPSKVSMVEAGTKTSRGANFSCLVCKNPIPREHIRQTGENGEFGAQVISVVAEGHKSRAYLSPDQVPEIIIERPIRTETISQQLADDPRAITVTLYGYHTFDQLFNDRQLMALLTFSDLLKEVHETVEKEARTDYADAVITYLAFALDKATNYWSNLCGWHFSAQKMMSTLGRNALPMIWDYAEANPFSESSGNWLSGVEQATKTIENLYIDVVPGFASQQDAAREFANVQLPVISTDPPYYDNVPYSDISDYFYVWLRLNLASSYPNLFKTLLTPKSPEIVAFSYRFDGDQGIADKHFEEKLGQTFSLIQKKAHPNYPVTVYYAFKQQEVVSGEGKASTGWEKMLEGLVQAGFTITGTWPMRTEQEGGLRLVGRNSLASSIVLVCRPRPEDAPITTRRDFLRLLKQELPAALRDLQRGNIAPVDLAQASIGPGMAIFSRHKGVLEADGSPMRVRTALALINQALDEYLAEQEGEYDADTRWALAWYEQFAFNEGPFGDAETLSKAKNTSVGGMVEAGILAARGGKVRLIKREELREDWDPTGDARLTVWEVAQYLIHTLDKRGESGAADLLSRVPAGPAEAARDLAYRLYTLCERKGWAGEALPYNSLVVAWPEVVRLAGEIRRSRPVQGRLI